VRCAACVLGTILSESRFSGLGDLDQEDRSRGVFLFRDAVALLPVFCLSTTAPLHLRQFFLPSRWSDFSTSPSLRLSHLPRDGRHPMLEDFLCSTSPRRRSCSVLLVRFPLCHLEGEETFSRFFFPPAAKAPPLTCWVVLLPLVCVFLGAACVPFSSGCCFVFDSS